MFEKINFTHISTYGSHAVVLIAAPINETTGISLKRGSIPEKSKT